jgi:hypothetical protein
LQHDETRFVIVGAFLPLAEPRRRNTLIPKGKGPDETGPILWIT